MNDITITINSTVENFATWLKDYTANVHLEFFPMSQGGCTLQAVRSLAAPESEQRQRTDARGNRTLLTMDAFYWDGQVPRSGSVYPWKNAIVFNIAPVADKQIKVTITCHYPSLMSYRNDLLIAILMHWPETQTQLTRLDISEADHNPQAIWTWKWPLLDE